MRLALPKTILVVTAACPRRLYQAVRYETKAEC